jgi:GAF domain-containing protein
MDTPPEETFDRLVRLASFICATPISLMTLLDDSRQWFKAKLGFYLDETPRSIAFCAYAIESDDEIMVVEDADARFAEHPHVSGPPKIRFYAGAPIRNSAGAALGTICVIDCNPRAMTAEQNQLLTDLAAIAVDEMELRIKNRQLLAPDWQRFSGRSGPKPPSPQKLSHLALQPIPCAATPAVAFPA